MYEQEKIKPYDGEGEKGKLIEEMARSLKVFELDLVFVFLESLLLVWNSRHQESLKC